MNTEGDVKRILASKKMNITARRWLNDKEARIEILQRHLSWNADHIKINEPDAIMTLEESVNYYLQNPSLIDKKKSF